MKTKRDDFSEPRSGNVHTDFAPLHQRSKFSKNLSYKENLIWNQIWT